MKAMIIFLWIFAVFLPTHQESSTIENSKYTTDDWTAVSSTTRSDLYSYDTNQKTDAWATNEFVTTASLSPLSLDEAPIVVPQIGDSEQTYISGGITTILEELQFRCVLNSLNSSWLYDINWYINGNQLQFTSTGLAAADLPSAVLREQHWSPAFKLGMQVKCSMAARLSQDGATGPFRTSPRFYAGFRVLTPSLFVSEGESKPVYFRSTVPLACWKTGGTYQRCYLQFEAETQPSSHYCSYWSTVSITDPESLKFCGPVIDSANWNGQVYVNVTGVHSEMYGYKLTQVKNTAIRHIPLFNTYRDVWDGVSLVPIQVTVTKNYRYNSYGSPMCYASNDPHMRTFDGRNYENQVEGIYVLYQHKQLPYSVHLMQRRCSDYRSKPVCNYGVAVQSGEDIFVMYLQPVIVIQNSGRAFTKRATVVTTYGCFKSGIKVIRGRGYSAYEIYLPSGTRIKIGQSLSSVYVYPSPYDQGQTEGLCGFYDGDKCNDLQFRNGTTDETCTSQSAYRYQPTDFITSWSVQQSEYLFYGVPTHSPPNPPITTFQGSNCACKLTGAPQTWDGLPTQEMRCSFHTPRIECVYHRSEDVSFFYASPCSSKRETNMFDLEEDGFTIADFDPDTSAANDTYEAGWTEATARAYCENFITTHKIYQSCKLVQNIDLEASVTACILDIQLTGDNSWAALALESFKGQCEEEAVKNETYWTADGNDVPILDQVVTSDCPLDCNNVGQCIDGTCKCDNGFGGTDCSIEVGVPPGNLTIPKSGLCDLSRKPCKATKVYGQAFIESEDLTCRMAECQVDRSGIHLTGHTEDVKGIFVNTYEVVCPLPDSTSGADSVSQPPWLNGYKVSISNNGQDFGEDATLLPYDPTCFDCLVQPDTLSCSLKVGFCYIDDACIASKVKDPGRSCYICDPTQLKLNWTYTGDVTGSQTGADTCGSSAVDAHWLVLTCGTFIVFVSSLVGVR